jgi:hypothetical protein
MKITSTTITINISSATTTMTTKAKLFTATRIIMESNLAGRTQRAKAINIKRYFFLTHRAIVSTTSCGMRRYIQGLFVRVNA